MQPDNISNVTAVECEQLTDKFTKKHIIIFDKFDGDCFNKVTKTPALYVLYFSIIQLCVYHFNENSFFICSILGPVCLTSSLMNDTSIPNIKSPIFNLAMRNLIICLSAYSLQEKVCSNWICKLNEVIA